MKITKEQLKEMIKEEIESLQEEKKRKLDPNRPGMYQDETPAEFSAAVGREKERKASLEKDKKQRDDLRKAKQQAAARAMGRLQEQEGSFLQISISDDGYDKDIEQISNPDEVDVDVSENPYVAYRAVVKVIKSSGEL